MPAPSPYSPLSSSDSCRRMASSSQTSSRRPMQSPGGRRCVSSSCRKVSVPPSRSPGIIQVGQGTGELSVKLLSLQESDHERSGQNTEHGTKILVPKYERKVHELTIQFTSSDQLLSLQLSRWAKAKYNTTFSVRYSTENFHEVQQQNLNLELNTRCNAIQYSMSTQIWSLFPWFCACAHTLCFCLTLS